MLMKNLLTIAVAALALVMSSCMSESQKALLGTWDRVIDDTCHVEYTFNDDGTFTSTAYYIEDFNEKLDDEGTTVKLRASYHYNLQGTYSFVIGVAELTYNNDKITGVVDDLELADPENTPEMVAAFFNDEMKNDKQYRDDLQKAVDENQGIREGNRETFTDVKIEGNTLTGKHDKEPFTMTRK